MIKNFLILLFGCSFFQILAQNSVEYSTNFETVTNPIVVKGADPWVIKDGDFFHYCYSKNGSIFLKSVKRISELKDASERKLWSPTSGTAYSKEIWAPELHFLQNRWYVYFAADDGKNENHRMHILATDGSNINEEFNYIGKLTDKSDKWAIDGSPFMHKGKLYFVWSGWEGEVNVQQNIYIAEMESPTAIKSERVLISQPDFVWEKRGSSKDLPTINEGPEILEKNGKYFLTYSAAGSWSDYYCLGMLELCGNDPLEAKSWKKYPKPVFESNESVTSPGHASFIKIKNQDYIIYHSARNKGAGWNRQVNIQPFGWKKGKPDFGVPVDYGVGVEIKY